MNKNIYRVIFNKARGLLMVVAEIARTQTKGSGASVSASAATASPHHATYIGRLNFTRLLATVVLGSLTALSPSAYADPATNTLPTGFQNVVGGSTVTVNGTHMTVHEQGADKTINEWQTFSIGSAASVRFDQQSSSSVSLNRVLSMSPSEIFGSLTSNGQVFLINPAGVTFGRGARVDVGGLVASTLDIGNQDFLVGRYNFINQGAAAGIQNFGDLKGGYVALIAPRITNEAGASVTALGGTAVLAAGDKVSLNIEGNSIINYTVSQGTIDALVENKGLIQVGDGVAVLTAKAADTVTKAVVNNSGVIEATGLKRVGGKVVMVAEGGQTLNSGTIDASSSGGKGGDVKLLGDQVALLDGSLIDVSGKTGGGTVNIGGGWQGKQIEGQANANDVYMDAGASIKADALETGNGGEVTLWSEKYTGFYGNISAKGGLFSGDGGMVETSSHDNLQALGQVNASAYYGQNGAWLLDPRSVIVRTTGSGSLSGGIFTPTSDWATISTGTIQTALNAGTNVTITTGATGTQSGDIYVSGTINKTAGGNATLTFKAARDIWIGDGPTPAYISASSGQLNVILNSNNANSASVGGVVVQAGSQITTNGGNIFACGGSAGCTGTVADGYAQASNGGTGAGFGLFGNSVINAGTGDIAIKGWGGTNGEGVALVGGSITGNAINLTGIGTTWNGVWMRSTAITGGAGGVNITGTATQATRVGTYIGGATTAITANNGGQVNLTGTGNTTGTGLYLDAGLAITANAGDVNVSGTGGSSGYGMYLNNVSIAATNSTVNLTGIKQAGANNTSDTVYAIGYLGTTTVTANTVNMTSKGSVKGGDFDNLNITANALNLTSTYGNIGLGGSDNEVNTLSANVDGMLFFGNNKDLVIAGITTKTGLDINTFDYGRTSGDGIKVVGDITVTGATGYVSLWGEGAGTDHGINILNGVNINVTRISGNNDMYLYGTSGAGDAVHISGTVNATNAGIRLWGDSGLGKALYLNDGTINTTGTLTMEALGSGLNEQTANSAIYAQDLLLKGSGSTHHLLSANNDITGLLYSNGVTLGEINYRDRSDFSAALLISSGDINLAADVGTITIVGELSAIGIR